MLSYQKQSDIDGLKRRALDEGSQRPQKKSRALLEDEDTSAEEDTASTNFGAVLVQEGKSSSDVDVFTVNQNFARRFEHNKRREELQKRGSIFTDYH